MRDEVAFGPVTNPGQGRGAPAMHRRFIIPIALAALVGCGSGNSSTTRTMTDEDRDARAAMAAHEERERVARERRVAAAEQRAADRLAAEQPSLLERMMDADGRGMCNVRLVDAARAITAAEGTLHRWTTTDLERRFPQKTTGEGDVVTYLGNAIEFMGRMMGPGCGSPTGATTTTTPGRSSTCEHGEELGSGSIWPLKSRDPDSRLGVRFLKTCFLRIVLTHENVLDCRLTRHSVLCHARCHEGTTTRA